MCVLSVAETVSSRTLLSRFLWGSWVIGTLSRARFPAIVTPPIRRTFNGEVWCLEGKFSEVELPLYGVLRTSPRKLPQLVYLGDAVPTVGLVGWSLLSNGAGLIVLLPRGRVNHRDR